MVCYWNMSNLLSCSIPSQQGNTYFKSFQWKNFVNLLKPLYSFSVYGKKSSETSVKNEFYFVLLSLRSWMILLCYLLSIWLNLFCSPEKSKFGPIFCNVLAWQRKNGCLLDRKFDILKMKITWKLKSLIYFNSLHFSILAYVPDPRKAASQSGFNSIHSISIVPFVGYVWHGKWITLV